MIKSIQQSLIELQDTYQPSFKLTNSNYDCTELGQSKRSDKSFRGDNSGRESKNYLRRSNERSIRYDPSRGSKSQRIVERLYEGYERSLAKRRASNPMIEKDSGEGDEYNGRKKPRRDFRNLKQRVIDHMMKNKNRRREFENEALWFE